MAKDENSIVFDIKSTKDIKQMQAKLNKLGISEEKKYIALEFAENMIEANLTGSIKINDVYIVNIIRACPKNNVDTLKNTINKVKDIKKHNIADKANLGNSSKSLLSILYADWDLDVKENTDNFSIVARKNALATV